MKESPEQDSATQQLLARISLMSKLREYVLGVNEDGDDSEEGGPYARDIESELRMFEETLDKVSFKLAGSDEEIRAFNLKLDDKLLDYRGRVAKSNTDQFSVAYKDSLYKLMVGSDLRNLGEVKMIDVYNKIANIVGAENVDPKLFIQAWEVMKARAEGRQNVAKDGGLVF